MNLFNTLNPSQRCAAAAMAVGMGAAGAAGLIGVGRVALQFFIARPGEPKDRGRVCR
jgi:hypothetical protein